MQDLSFESKKSTTQNGSNTTQKLLFVSLHPKQKQISPHQSSRNALNLQYQNNNEIFTI